MSLREEDKQKTNSSSRSLGLGLAAAAIGVGIGAALYYVFSKEEAPDTEGSTSSQWTSNSPQTFHEDLNSSNDYTTVSEHTTTDTSMYEESQNSSNCTDEEEYMTQYSDISSSPSSHCETISTSSFSDSTHDSDMSDVELDSNEWEVDTSLELPNYNPPSYSPVFNWFNTLVSARPERNRERTWSLEECSICFEVILKNQEVMTLSCTHNFHQSCILPWLQEQQTCPNCRKAVD